MLYLVSNLTVSIAYAKFSTQNSIILEHKFCAQYQILALAQKNKNSLEMLLGFLFSNFMCTCYKWLFNEIVWQHY